MARSGFRVLRFVVVAVLLVLVVYKLSAQRVDFNDYVGNTHVSNPLASKPKTGNADGKNQGQSQQSSLTDAITGATSKVTKPAYERANATFVSLARNEDLYELVKSIREVEDRFNHQYNYDWVFLNDKEFTDDFKDVTSALVSGTTHYGKINDSEWGYPEWIDQDKAAQTREQMRQDQVIYGDSVSYRHMCRYESGFFWRHPIMNNFKYYWRVEPSIRLHCDIPYDVFKFMEEKKKKYAFTISLREYEATIKTLWETTKSFIREHPEHVAPNNAMDWISQDGGETYNLCHFWSNFEIADLDFWRGEAYSSYFDYLDKNGGFFYERWGDAPVHSIGAALFLNKEEIHFFYDVGYYHVPFTNCPANREDRLRLKCTCKAEDDFSFEGYSCTSRWYEINNLAKPLGAKS